MSNGGWIDCIAPPLSVSCEAEIPLLSAAIHRHSWRSTREMREVLMPTWLAVAAGRASKKRKRKGKGGGRISRKIRIPDEVTVQQWLTRLPEFAPITADEILRGAKLRGMTSAERNYEIATFLKQKRDGQVRKVLAALDVPDSDKAFEIAFMRLAGAVLGLGAIDIAVKGSADVPRKQTNVEAKEAFLKAVAALSRQMSERKAVRHLAEKGSFPELYRPHTRTRMRTRKAEIDSRYNALWKLWISRGKSRPESFPLRWFIDIPETRSDLERVIELMKFEHVLGEFESSKFPTLFEFPQG